MHAEDLAAFQAAVEKESSLALEKGGLYSALLGLAGGLVVFSLVVSRTAENLLAPLVFSLFAGTYSLLVFFLARKGLMKGATLYLTFLPFVSLPTIFFLLTHLVMPAGAATFITGPISYLYFHLIIMTGFVFRARLSILAGFVSAAGYAAVYLLGRGHLAGISSPDPTLTQDLTSLPIYAIKGIMMIFGGLLVAALSVIVKRLILRVMEEERQKATLSRLFGQYVSPEVREEIIRHRSATIGELRKVVVLFSDLRSFSAYSEGRDPEHIVAHLNEYFDAMVKAITSEGGVIDKFMGDAVMAVFGGVLDLEHPAEAALAAARKMRTSLSRLNASWTERGLPHFENGIGMHWGEVLQGPIGSEDRKEFTVIGDAVNTASRIEGLTRDRPFKVVVTDAFHSELPDRLRHDLVDLGTVTVKGKREEIRIWGLDESR